MNDATAAPLVQRHYNRNRYNWAGIEQAARDYAELHPEGFTKDDLRDALGVDEDIVNHAIYLLRRTFSIDDAVNLVADPQGKGERWRYRLVNQHREARGWQDGRVGDMMTRCRTMLSVAKSIERAEDPDTLNGAQARVMRRDLQRLNEDLQELHRVLAAQQ